MKSWIVVIDCGYGMAYKEVKAKSKVDASVMAYEWWREEAEEQAHHRVIGEATEELREKYLRRTT